MTPDAAATAPADDAPQPAPQPLDAAALGIGRRPVLLLLDGSWALFRAFYAIRGMHGPDGRPTGAVFGILRQLEDLHRRVQPAAVAICFDETDTGFRTAIDPTYKANRGETPPELADQWPRAVALLEALGQRTLQHGQFEADDLIATLATRGCAAGFDVVIASADKDLGQLVADGDPRVVQYDPGKDLWLDAAAVEARWGVPPAAVPEVQALVGDAIDNIRGVAGIGAKTAAKIIREFGSVEGALARIDAVRPDKAQAALRAGAADARRCLQLVRLVCDAPIADRAGVPLDLDDLAPRLPDVAAAISQAAHLGFSGLSEWLSKDEGVRWPPPRRRRAAARAGNTR